MKTVKSLKDCSLLIKGIIEAIKNETEERVEFLVCYQVHWVQVCWEICLQVTVWLEQTMELPELERIFDSALFFEKLWNENINWMFC